MEKKSLFLEPIIRSSVHVDNKRKDTLILDEGPIQGLDDTALAAEAKYPSNFTQSGKKICIKPTL